MTSRSTSYITSHHALIRGSGRNRGHRVWASPVVTRDALHHSLDVKMQHSGHVGITGDVN